MCGGEGTLGSSLGGSKCWATFICPFTSHYAMAHMAKNHSVAIVVGLILFGQTPKSYTYNAWVAGIEHPKGFCHLVIQCATSSVGKINQSKPKNEKTHQLEKVCSFLE